MPLLMGNRVRLAAFKADDVAALTHWHHDSDFVRRFHASPVRPRTEDEWRKWYEKLPDEPYEYHFAVRLVDDETCIGIASIDGILWNQRNGWISLGIGEPTYRGQGLGGETMRLLIDFAFRELNLHRLSLTVFGYNQPAIKLYEKLGFVREGVHREHLYRDGEFHDMLLYGLLDREWKHGSTV